MWRPSAEQVAASNIGQLDSKGIGYARLHEWSITDREAFWQTTVDRLKIAFRSEPSSVVDLADGAESPHWLPDAGFNIFESCFQAPESSAAIVTTSPGGGLRTISVAELRAEAMQIAGSLRAAGFATGDAIAIVMPMVPESISIYLGIIAAGCVAVSIADSFAPPEIQTRLEISNAKGIFCMASYERSGRTLDLYSRVKEANSPTAIVIGDVDLRDGDMSFAGFMAAGDRLAEPVISPAATHVNILFSSGTTGTPKAIPWNQTVPIKCAADGMWHHDIREGDVVVWPTNIGWMMGPWLIFASLINRATIGLYHDVPMGAGFGQFVQDAQVTMLGVVPTIVRAWRASGCMEQFDWNSVRCFSSTGEASNPDDMFYLSWLANYRPVIEYCGGTEIGGGYVTSVVVEPNIPAVFNTPAAGSEFLLLDEEHEIAEEGEVFLVPPTIGLSSRLVNRDHHATYYADVPNVDGYQQLRRHGDHFRRLAGSVYVAGGRVDDTMNLGGIKISSAEIERVLNAVDGVKETAAVAVNLDAGPTSLVVFVVLTGDEGAVSESLTQAMNVAIKSNLNPLFKISQLVLADSLPRTASGKVMRRKLRDRLAT
jgi:acetyl-CoA synthetase